MVTTAMGAHVLFDLYKAIDDIESTHKSYLFLPERPIFLHACAICSELPSNISTLIFFMHLEYSPSYSAAIQIRIQTRIYLFL